jgi:SOS response regulatory protein OraA/RecX
LRDGSSIQSKKRKSIRGELAQKGLTDSRLDDNFRIERPKEENLRAIVEGLRFLASKLDD